MILCFRVMRKASYLDQLRVLRQARWQSQPRQLGDMATLVRQLTLA